MKATDRLLLAAVNHPDQPPPQAGAGVIAAVERHNFAPFAFNVLAGSGHAGDWPLPLRGALQRAAAAQALLCGIRDDELRRVLDGIAEAGVGAAVIKGAALAATHYPEPHLRPRGDTDLAIRAGDRDAAWRVLESLGYRRTGAVDGDLVTQQCQWYRELRGGIVHVIDVHWRLFNPHAFGAILPVDVLIDGAAPAPGLGSSARAANPVHALLLACVHRVAHHAGEHDLLWLCDIHLLVESLDPPAVEAFVTAARQARVGAIVGDGIRAARACFGTRLPPPIEALIAERDGRAEPTSMFLTPARRQVDVLTSDLAALAGWRARARLVRQHLFPPAAYMTRKYHLRTPLLLPLVYARRIAAGVPRWMRRPRP